MRFHLPFIEEQVKKLLAFAPIVRSVQFVFEPIVRKNVTPSTAHLILNHIIPRDYGDMDLLLCHIAQACHAELLNPPELQTSEELLDLSRQVDAIMKLSAGLHDSFGVLSQSTTESTESTPPQPTLKRRGRPSKSSKQSTQPPQTPRFHDFLKRCIESYPGPSPDLITFGPNFIKYIQHPSLQHRLFPQVPSDPIPYSTPSYIAEEPFFDLDIPMVCKFEPTDQYHRPLQVSS